MFRLRVDTVIRSSSSLQDASVSGPGLRRQWEHFMPCVRTPRGLNGSQQLREPPQNFCYRSRTAGGRVRGSFLLKPVASGGVSSQRYWSVCPAVSRCVLAEQVCSVQHSSVPEPQGRLGHPAGAGSGLWLSAGGAMGPAVCTSLCPAAPRAVSATDLSSPPLVCLSVPTSRLERLQDVCWQRGLRGVGHPLLAGSLL